MSRRIISSVGIKLGLAVVLIEAVALVLLGYVYTRRFSARVDELMLENLRKPGLLMAQGALRPEAFDSTAIMRRLVGDGLVEGLVVGANGNIFHSLDPSQIGSNFSQVSGADADWLTKARSEALLLEARDATNSYLVSLTPIVAVPGRGPLLFAYLKLRSTEAQEEKAAIARRFLIGSVIALGATSAAIILLFYWMIRRRLRRLVEVVGHVEQGDLGARVPGPTLADEIGTLELGVNDMATQLQQTIASLEKSVSSLTVAEAAWRENEEKFRRVFEAAPVPLLMVRLEDGVVVMANPAAAELVHLEPDKVIGGHFQQLYAKPDDYARLLSTVRQFDRADHFEVEIQPPRGDRRWIGISAAPLQYRESTDLLIGMVDLTDSKRAEEERLQMDRRILEAQRHESLGVMSAGIAHDFNNLLTGVLGNASLARMDLPPGSTMDMYMQQIETAARRAADLCKQMLAFSGKGHMVMRNIDLSRLVQEVTPLLQLSVSTKVSLHFELAPGLPLILADDAQMRQVIVSLVSNASEAIGEREGVVSVRTRLVHADHAVLADSRLGSGLSEGNYVSIEVTDTGCGMTQDIISRIFDPFFSTKFLGRGLGLPAVLGIVRSHKGTIRVQSQPSIGSTFQILLPVAAGGITAVRPSAIRSDTWTGSGTVMVVDDEEPVRRVAQRILESLNFKVIVTANGHEAVNRFRELSGELGLVLLDLTMPQMNGVETCKQLREISPGVQVLLMSGFDEAEAVSRFSGQGLAGFVQKPFEMEDLRAKLRSVLDKGKPTTS